MTGRQETEVADGLKGTLETGPTKEMIKEGDREESHYDTPTMMSKMTTRSGKTCKIMILPMATTKEIFGTTTENIEWLMAIEDIKHDERFITTTK